MLPDAAAFMPAPIRRDPPTPTVDVNAVVAGALRDMASAQQADPRRWGYKEAARVVRELEQPIDRLVRADGTLPRIPRIGPASTRIIQEVLASGRSAIVEQAVDRSGQRAEVDRRRAWRTRFLSRAAAREVVSGAGAALRAAYRGDLQMHSTWSDGSQTLEALVSGCAARGYAYAAVTDHSAGLPIAGGLSLERLRAQGVEIERLNRASPGFRLLRGVEANIRGDGSVDVEPADRRGLDVVVAAPHSGLRSANAQTERMTVAASSPGVHVLGHPRGRMYGSRPGVAADWRQVFDVAARHGVAIEIDGDPSRQDVDYELAGVALESGCLFALDSDAHAVSQLWYAEIAMAHAVLAGIPADRIVNTWTLDKLMSWADSRQRG